MKNKSAQLYVDDDNELKKVFSHICVGPYNLLLL